MPEAPDLQIVLEYLQPRVVGREVAAAREVRPLVLRNLTGERFAADIAGREITGVTRHGKLLFFTLSGERLILINPMLTGGLRYSIQGDRVERSVHVIIELDDGREIRYFDQKKMGMVYYLRPDQMGQTPRVEEQGPDVLDSPMSLQELRDALRPFRGEIKGLLTRGRLVSGIGNAYADEILHSAGIHPFKRRGALSGEEIRRLHRAIYDVPRESIEYLRGRTGGEIHRKHRDHLGVHGKGGQPCPDCGYPISAITANQRETNFCRKCQPGLLIRN